MRKQPRSRSYIKPLSIALLVVAIGFGYLHVHHTPSHIKVAKATRTASANSSPGSTDTHATAPHTDMQLQQIIDTWAAQHSFSSSVVVAETNGSFRTASRNSTAQMVTASTYKIYVAYATLHEVEQGTYSMNTVTRTGQTVSSALQKMILQSNNDSAEALGFLVGWDRVDQLAANAGAARTDINNYDSSGNPANGDKHSTAADLTTMVTKLQQGALLNASDTQLLLGLMKNQVWRERVPAGVPSGIAVADKPGWLTVAEGDGENVQNDAAIVYGPKSTYTLVIMTNSSSTQPLADLSKLIYGYLEQ